MREFHALLEHKGLQKEKTVGELREEKNKSSSPQMCP